MGITITLTHRLLAISRSSPILNRGFNARIIPAFIGARRTAASAAIAKKPITKAAAASSKTPKSSEKGEDKATAAKSPRKTKTAAKKPAKPKTAAKKPAKKVAKKDLTEEQQKKLLIRELKAKALKPPARSLLNGYTLYFAKRQKEGGGNIFDIAKEWRALPQNQKDEYAQKGADAQPARGAEFKKWLQSTSPFVIREANNARRRLKALGVLTGVATIPDDRLPKRIARPLFLYISEQYANGRKFESAEGKRSVIVGQQLMTEEYAKLPASEKKRFEDLVEKNKKEYDSEMQRLEKVWNA